MREHLYPLERDKTKNKANQIALHEGVAKPQAPVLGTLCGRWEMKGGRGKGGEDFEGKSPRNNPSCQPEFHLLSG